MRFQEHTLYDLDVKVTQYVAQYCPHYMTYASAKFEVAKCNGLGGAFTRKYIIWSWPWGQGHTKCCPVPSTSCDTCTFKVWRCYVQQFRRRHNYKKCDRHTTDGLWYEINILFFSYEKEGIIIRFTLGTQFTFGTMSAWAHLCHFV